MTRLYGPYWPGGCCSVGVKCIVNQGCRVHSEIASHESLQVIHTSLFVCFSSIRCFEFNFLMTQPCPCIDIFQIYVYGDLHLWVPHKDPGSGVLYRALHLSPRPLELAGFLRHQHGVSHVTISSIMYYLIDQGICISQHRSDCRNFGSIGPLECWFLCY